MGLAHGEWKKKNRETRGCVGRCVQDEDREKWAEKRTGGWLNGGWEGRGRHGAGIKSPIKLHGGILIYRLMSYCVTNHSRAFQRTCGGKRCNKLKMLRGAPPGESTASVGEEKKKIIRWDAHPGSLHVHAVHSKKMSETSFIPSVWDSTMNSTIFYN